MLREELARPEYRSLSDAEAAEALNAMTVSKVGAISSELLRQRLVMMFCETDPRYPLALSQWRALAEASPGADAKEADVARWRVANVLVEAYRAQVPVNFGSEEAAGLAGMAVSLGLLTQAQLDRLIADATYMTSRADEIGLGSVSHETIAKARAQ